MPPCRAGFPGARRRSLNSVDIVLIVAIGSLAVKGAVRGFFRETCGLLALTCGVGASVLLGASLGENLLEPRGLDPRWARVVAHAAAFLLPYIGLQAMGYVLHRLGRAVFLGGLDRVGGALFGALSGVLLAGAGLHLAVGFEWGGRWLTDSRLAHPLAEAFRRSAEWASGLVP